jgi:hypothetical protein
MTTSSEDLMPTDLPIACSLIATDLTERLAQMAALGRDALVDADVTESRAMLRFAAGAGVRERLAAIVAAESECCAFLTMGVHDEPDVVVLTIDAPEGAEPVLHELADAFDTGRRAAR